MYCIIAVLIAIIVSWYLRGFIKRGAPHITRTLTYDTNDISPLIIGICTVFGLWLWGNGITLPAYDEVFSAQNAAGIHPFQCVSYYMLPNNHLFFNLVNSILFHLADDKVATGRIISLLAYCTLIIALFFWLKQFMANRWLALLACITLALQFPVWGFSFQARGYECYLLAQWGMVIALFSYLSTSHARWLFINALCSAIGYFCLPSFLYMHVAQLVFMLLYQFLYKRSLSALWKAQLAAILLAFLFYLPALCFSGLQSIINNDYVASITVFKNAGVGAFLQWMFPALSPNIDHIFSNIHWNNIPFNLPLFLTPLLLLFDRKNKATQLFGLFWLCMWITFLLIAIIMRRLPFERNLIAQYSISLAAVLLLAYRLATTILSKTKLPFKQVVFATMLLLFSIHFISTNKASLKNTLYEIDVNATYTTVVQGLSFIQPGNTAAFSDVAFYCYYICSKKGVKTSKCPTGNEQYYIRQRDDQLPLLIADNYLLVNKFDQYEIYKHK